MKQGVPYRWDHTCQNSFYNIKQYLMNSSFLISLIIECVYITTLDTSRGTLLAYHNDNEKEHGLYYLTDTMVGAELNYSPIKNICLALIFAIQKLKHYLLTTIVQLISKADPLKYIISCLSIHGRLVKWTIFFIKI